MLELNTGWWNNGGEIDNACRGDTALDGGDNGGNMNGVPFEHGGTPHHYSKIGEVIERRIWEHDEHPYHQHIFPFMIVSGFEGSAHYGAYFRPGDFHDVLYDPTYSGWTFGSWFNWEIAPRIPLLGWTLPFALPKISSITPIAVVRYKPLKW